MMLLSSHKACLHLYAVTGAACSAASAVIRNAGELRGQQRHIKEQRVVAQEVSAVEKAPDLGRHRLKARLAWDVGGNKGFRCGLTKVDEPACWQKLHRKIVYAKNGCKGLPSTLNLALPLTDHVCVCLLTLDVGAGDFVSRRCRRGHRHAGIQQVPQRLGSPVWRHAHLCHCHRE